MRIYTCLFLLVCLLGISCKSAYEKSILPVDRMKLVMWDMLKADELYLRMIVKDSTAKKRKENIRLYEQVFLIHRISKGKFDSSYKYYETHPVQFKILIDSLEAFSMRERDRTFDNPVKAR
jgi:hypothetical protein